MRVRFKTPLQMSTAEINPASVVLASGQYVEADRRPDSDRVVFTFDDLEATRELLSRYEHGAVLEIPAKALFAARNELYYRAKRAKRGAY